MSSADLPQVWLSVVCVLVQAILSGQQGQARLASEVCKRGSCAVPSQVHGGLQPVRLPVQLQVQLPHMLHVAHLPHAHGASRCVKTAVMLVAS